jgi:hypothetical protein
MYNWNGSLAWDYINQSAKLNAEENWTTTIGWNQRNLTNYVNRTTGEIWLLFEDTQEDSGIYRLKIDFLEINATISQLNNTLINITNSTGNDAFNGTNYTRTSGLNASADWVADNVTAGKIWINAAGNVSWHILSQIGTNWTNYTFNFSNVTVFPLGGNITINISANDTWNQTNTTANIRWFGLLSNASIISMMVNESGSVASRTPVRAYCRVADMYSGVPLSGYNVTFFNNSAQLGYSNTNSTGWAGVLYGGSATAGDYVLSCNVTDNVSVWYFRAPDNNLSSTVDVVSDGTVPNITALWIDSAGVNGSYRTNLYMNISVLANVSDVGTSVSAVNMSVLFPNSKTRDVSLQPYGTGGWRYVFAANDTIGFAALNATGNYTINVSAMDLADNANISWNLTFNVTNNYSVLLENYTAGNLYNRGENLTFTVADENGVAVSGANLTANVTFPAVTTWLNYANDTAMLNLTSPYNVTNYTVRIVAVKGNNSNNTGYAEFNFSVTNVLNLKLTNSSYRPGLSQVVGTASSSVRFYVNNTRDGRFLYNMTVANITCANGGNWSLTRDPTADYYYNDTGCTSPATYSTTFYIDFNVSDTANNNTGTARLALTTIADPGGGGGTATGGGGGGGTTTKNCSCEWVSTDICGIEGCGSTQVLQRWVCNPAGCKLPDNTSSTTRCVHSPAFCEINRRGFNFTIGDVVLVKRGESSVIRGKIENTGNVTLNISVVVGGGCCRAGAASSAGLPADAGSWSVLVQNLSFVDVPITVHAALGEKLGDYLFSINLTDESGLFSSGVFTVRVNESSLLEEKSFFAAELERLRAELLSYEAQGLDVSKVREALERLEGSLNSAGASVSTDDLAGLQAQIVDARQQLESAKAELGSMFLWKFALENRYAIIAAVIVAFILLYLITEIAVPYVRLTAEIKRMADKEQSQVEARKATEKQYFMGKIDEKAFEDILIGKQSEILTTKGTARHKMQERDELVRKKLSPSAVKGWLVSVFGLRPLAGRLLARLRKNKKPWKAPAAKK